MRVSGGFLCWAFGKYIFIYFVGGVRIKRKIESQSDPNNSAWGARKVPETVCIRTEGKKKLVILSQLGIKPIWLEAMGVNIGVDKKPS